jgi:hypothetical protein
MMPQLCVDGPSKSSLNLTRLSDRICNLLKASDSLFWSVLVQSVKILYTLDRPMWLVSPLDLTWRWSSNKASLGSSRPRNGPLAQRVNRSASRSVNQ